ncbi:MAG: hydrogenase maturation nickel metallochaperone HypA [Deltaproteobacteria bacterium]|nr:MAG: hydrogenase maturation nickel metallochaperone HypA [Deltaproteobacteria bacterium]
MHEMSIAQSLIDIIREEMARHNACRLRSVRLRIGRLSAIVPESLSFCFEIITTGTDLEGAKLLMDLVPLRGRCRQCGREFEIEEYAFECPLCGGPDIETTAGRELSIVDMEVD